MNSESMITLKQMRKELKQIETELDQINSTKISVIKSSIRKNKNVPFIDILEREFDLLDKQFEKYMLL